MINIRHEVLPFLGAALLAGGVLFAAGRLCGLRAGAAGWTSGILTGILCAYFVYFFRNPPRTPPDDPNAVLAGADGDIAAITELPAERFCDLARGAGLDLSLLGRLTQEPCLRISIFLSLFDVHVNRAPITGTARFLGYFPGRHFFTFQEKSSDVNQHNSILIENESTSCLINQIVGPICRRVVYWPDHDRAVPVTAGDPIGMMKFGSRLDIYLPAADVRLLQSEGDTVRAGETIIARIKRNAS